MNNELMFPEMYHMKVDKARGMNIGGHDGQNRRGSAGRAAPQLMGMPFRTNKAQGREIDERKVATTEKVRKKRNAQSLESVTGTVVSCADGPADF